ncbi:BTAD domain-containing putative transcriptional regulator [Spirillospora sp. CA-294931]|uniref:BTAD domain-containing putative transcriptional regulator n=1 Tax=Spirillospora sp. CA-294931 TaxID=3240042 RepID=UPI003D8A5BE4
MRFGVLGPLAVWAADGRPAPIPELKVRALLADLLAHEGRPVSSDRLIDDLWGERLPRNPIGTLHTRVSQLRRALDAAEPGARELVVSQPPGYLLRLDGDALDAARFRALVARARAATGARERSALLGRALALWRGAAYADFADAEFARPAAARLEEERLVALEEHAEARLDLGEHGELAGELADLVGRHPLRERLRAAHLRALYRAGRQNDALAGYAELRERLAEELGLDPGPQITALHRAILRHDPSLAPVRRGGNLPAPVTELIGRADAVTRVRALLKEGRLVTLTGPGGVGKTRLAVEAGREHGGAWLVELAGLDRASSGAAPDAVAGVVAAVLDLRDDDAPGPPPLDRLAGALRGRDTLLVLDNCEHVIEPVATLVSALLADVPGLRVLATSQEPLGIAGERLWAVPPLDLPEGDDDAARSSAVELFVARAAAAAPGFALGPGNAAAVAAICRRLDGIPLVLELAATRVRALGVDELAARLDDRFAVLVAGRRGAPARQRTLRAMIDWSWEPLPEPERVLLRRLAVHADGFALDAAEAMGTGVLDSLARLVDRSLVTVADGGARYSLLESVRAYGLERLREAGEEDEIRRRHLAHYTALAERADLRGPGQRGWLERLDREWANLRTALDTAARLGEAATAHRLARALTWYWFLRGRLAEGLRSLDLVLAMRDDPETAVWRAGLALLVSDGAERGVAASPEAIGDPAARARARWFTGYALRGFADLAVTAEILSTALAEFRALDDRWGVAAALGVRATIARARGELDAAARDARESATIFGSLGDGWGRLKATNTLAELAEIAGDYTEAARLHREGLRMAEDLSLWGEASFRLSGLGRIALLRGDHAEADAFHRRAMRTAADQSNRVAEHFAEVGLALSARRQGRFAEVETHLAKWVDWLRGVDGEPGLALVRAELGFAAEQRGDAAAALRHHRASLASARAIGDPRAVALALEGLAGAHALDGDPVRAARLLGRAASLRDSVGAPLPEAERGDVTRITAALRTVLGDEKFETEHAHGSQPGGDADTEEDQHAPGRDA